MIDELRCGCWGIDQINGLGRWPRIDRSRRSVSQGAFEEEPVLLDSFWDLTARIGRTFDERS